MVLAGIYEAGQVQDLWSKSGTAAERVENRGLDMFCLTILHYATIIQQKIPNHSEETTPTIPSTQ